MIRRDEDDGSFDIDFWQSLGSDAIFSAMYEMTKEVYALRGLPRETRLRRDKVRIIIRRRTLRDPRHERNQSAI